ncbi:TNF receptor-associated factor 2-like [Halichondria panicea]|uniref:TNF receptor-associated factor 2-like n=1 Tax=Halichondria panicea TaxID=6063 RepID=UPI00312B7029
MATSKLGYEYEFVYSIKNKYVCKQCKHVAREANTATCCGETFCKECIETIIQEKKGCPSCKNDSLSSKPHRKYQAKILAQEVRCSKEQLKEEDDTPHSGCTWNMFQCMFPALKHCHKKVQGCKWTGQLQHLGAHLDLTTGDCVYVDVDCPKSCEQKVQKCNVGTHLAKECPNRDYTCPKCYSRTTFCEASQHLKVCHHHFHKCLNGCGAIFKRDYLEDHNKICSQQKVQCEFRYAGCEAEFIRDKQKEHIEQNTQKHLALIATILATQQELQQANKQELQKQQQIFEQKFRDQYEKKHEVVVKELKDMQVSWDEFQRKTNEETDMQHQKLESSLGAKDEQIKQLQTAIAENKKTLGTEHRSDINSLRLEVGAPPYEIVFTDYQKYKRENMSSPLLKVHSGGYVYSLTLYPNGTEGGTGSHLSLKISLPAYSKRPLDHKDQTDHPSSLKITIELLNQHRDQDHITRVMTYESSDFMRAVKEYGFPERVMPDIKFISLADLEWNPDRQTQYLKDDCLKFRVVKQEITSWRKRYEP